MPFESEAQRRFMYSQHPELAKEFEKATPKDADLPEHVKKMADGGYPHVTFMEDQTPAENEKTTHLADAPKMAEGGEIHKAEGRDKEPAKPKNIDKSHEEKLKSIYKAMGFKGYDGGGAAVQTPDPNTPPSQSDPSFWDKIGAALSQAGTLGLGPTGGAAGIASSVAQNAAPTIAQAAPAVVSALNNTTGASLPVPAAPAPIAANPAVSAPNIVPPTPSAMPPAMMSASNGASGGSNPANSTLSGLFNGDTSSLEKGVTADDRQALVAKLQAQQHGLGNVIAEAVSGLGDALAAKGGREQHSLQNIFSMQQDQRNEALANFDKARQDRLQKLDLQTKMGQNAIQKLAAQDAYGTDDHLNAMLGAPAGTAHKDLPLYFQAKAAGVAQQEKDADLYMKAHQQAATDVDNAVKNASMLNIKPSSEQLQASGAKLADQYYNKAKGNVMFQPSDGQKAVWIPAGNVGKARQMDPAGQIVP